MFVYPVSNRQGSYSGHIINAFTGKQESFYIGVRTRAHPKIRCELEVSKRLSALYGEKRAEWISCIPHFINRMKFGCGVSVVLSRCSVRGKTYKNCRVIWTEYSKAAGRSPRRCKQWLLSHCPIKNREIEHRAGLFAAQKRAELSLSQLDPGVLTLEFDLEI